MYPNYSDCLLYTSYEHPLFYHNSYLLTDLTEAYVLDTVGRYWAYKKLMGNYNISNKISIQNDFDDISPELKGKVQSLEKYFTNPIVSYLSLIHISTGAAPSITSIADIKSTVASKFLARKARYEADAT